MSDEPLLSSVVLRPDDLLLAQHAAIYGDSPGDRALTLARALVTSPGWGQLAERARLVVRLGPQPLVAVVGMLDAQHEPQLRALGWQVRDALIRLRPVTYANVEAECQRLADLLNQRLGPDRMAGAHLIGVPRGGAIVAGLLSYCLGLPASQVGSTLRPGGLVVVVDDCVLSGARTRRWLRSNPGPQVALAHLHSHPEARAALELDPRVLACVAAADLRDHAPQQQGWNYDHWMRQWRERSPDDYWTGHPDHVCYPWNEPDAVVWNSVTGGSEPGWHVLPPSWCLKNRRAAGAPDVQICSDAAGARLVPSDVIWADLSDGVVLVQAGVGSSRHLSGSAGDFWRALMTFGTVEEATAHLAEYYEVSPAKLQDDVECFIDELADRGLLSL